MNTRTSGVIIHPTSFYGKYGCGDLGHESREIIDWMKKCGFKILQVLPLGPTGFGDSPYQPFSAFAGNPYLISFDLLIEKGYLTKDDLNDYPEFDPDRVDYYGLYTNNFKILYRAYSNSIKNSIPVSYEKFCSENSYWLEDYSMFMTIKEKYNGSSWDVWNSGIRKRKNLDKIKEKLKDKIDFYKFIQWEFSNQWADFKDYANKNEISIIGDVPIFVSYDSADVWANQKLFYLDKSGKPSVVAGVPPDYFSQTGQLWGNPLYRWNRMKKDGYIWWKNRISHLLKFVDCIRIDHFRGFESYWSIPYQEKTAINGKWVKAPGINFFTELHEKFGELNKIIIAEDLGVITSKVKRLRDRFKLPGMRIFEFAEFPEVSDNISKITVKDAYLPHNYKRNCIAYPGTHDNDTLAGWFESLDDNKRQKVMYYLKISGLKELNQAVIKLLLKSKADRVIFLIQDILELPTEHRFNKPSTCGPQNWTWRLKKEMLTDEIAKKIHQIVKGSKRI